MTARKATTAKKTTTPAAKDTPADAGDGGGEMVNVRVAVNHDQFRRGETGEVELTDVVRRRLDAGYLMMADDDTAHAAPLGSGAARPAPGSLLGVTSSNPPEEGGGDGQGEGDSQD